MSYEFLAILLAVVGCGLIVAEIFIPSGGMILVLCILSFIAAVWCAHAAWWEASPGYFWGYIGTMIVVIPALVIGTFRVLAGTKVGDRILLAAPDISEVTPYQKEADRLSAFIGRRGVSLTLLTPGGMIKIDGERLHGFTEGILIEPGQPVEVVAVRGTRVLVQPVDEAPQAADEAGPGGTGEEDQERLARRDAPLDFDVPQG